MQIDIVSLTVSIGHTVILRELTGSIPAGLITAVVGPSGSGKSTLLGALAGRSNVTDGEIRFMDRNGLEVTTRPTIAWVSQGANGLPRRTVLDNVMLGPLSRGHSLVASRAGSLQALNDVGLASDAGRYLRTLSGGEAQRVAFARGLASRSDIILADEPSSNLDKNNTQQVLNLLRDLRREVTVVVATHDLEVVDAADHVINLR